MKKFWITILMGMASLAYGKELDTFSDVSNALMRGDSIRLVVQSASTGFSFCTEANSVILQPTYLQFANNHLTTNHPGYENIPLLENVTYRISDDGEVRIITRVILLPDYKVRGEHSMIYLLGGSAKIYTRD